MSLCRTGARRGLSSFLVRIVAGTGIVLMAACSSAGASVDAVIEHGDGVPSVSPAFVGWASELVAFAPGVERWSEDDAARALGPASGNSFDVLVLGRGGSATFSFGAPITDGPGADFAVFENGFLVAGNGLLFAELAFVEVSTDGRTFVRFPASTVNSAEVGNEGLNPDDYAGFGGLHPAGTGTAFDLSRLDPAPTRVTHVRIVDVIGDGSTLDDLGNPIFDPYPTSRTAGFDLDAIGVLSQ